MARITNKKELKEYLLDRVSQSRIFLHSDPSRFDAINDVCGTILKDFLKYVQIDENSEDEFTSVVSECTSIYIEFCAKINAPADLDKEERYWMKKIVIYLNKVTSGDLSKVAPSWQKILSEWETYNETIRDWPKLRHINKHLQTIVMTLKNRKKNGRQQKNDRHSQEFRDVAAELAYRGSNKDRSRKGLPAIGQDDS